MQIDLKNEEILEIKKALKKIKNKIHLYEIKIDGKNYKLLEVARLVQEMQKRKMHNWKKINKWAGSVVGISEK